MIVPIQHLRPEHFRQWVGAKVYAAIIADAKQWTIDRPLERSDLYYFITADLSFEKPMGVLQIITARFIMTVDADLEGKFEPVHFFAFDPHRASDDEALAVAMDTVVVLARMGKGPMPQLPNAIMPPHPRNN